MIDDSSLRRFFEVVHTRLRGEILPGLVVNETEPQYTQRVLQPIARRILTEIEAPGMVCGGDGGVPTHRTNMLGMTFAPDLEFSYRGQRLVAIENKFVTYKHRQRSIASAMGQALVYRIGGFPLCIVLLLDLVTSSYANSIRAAPRLSTDDIRIIVKRRNHLGQFVSE